MPTSSAPSPTERWLANAVQPYSNANRVYSDTAAVLAAVPTVRPKSDVYTFDDGRTQLLLCIHGLLPILYRAASYNIPIALWITRDYPRKPPIAYVVPSGDLLVKPGRYVDVSGRCEIEYIQHWTRKSEGCSLVGLLEAMRDHFSREPPLYARTSPRPQPRSSSSPAPPALPPKPLPASNPDHPLLPPRPPANPALPHLPVPRPVSSIRHTPAHPTPPFSIAPHATPQSPPPPPPPLLPQTFFQQITSLSPSHHPHSPTPPAEPPVPSPPSRPAINLLDEDSPNKVPFPVSGPPPPRPPNPELLSLHSRVSQKLASEISSLTQVTALDGERLRAHQSDLLAGEPAIRDEMARLEAVRDVCRAVSGRLSANIQQAEMNIADLRRKGDPEVDELVCSTTIVFNQFISLVAEDNAIEDTIYHLHRALNAGRIDLDRFLRSTRLLAEEQFMKRALVNKIQFGTPLNS